MPAIAVNQLTVRYPARAAGPRLGAGDPVMTTAVDGLDLEVDQGEVVALLGPNGAGKTTTLEAVEGYRRPDGGSVRVFGLDPMTNRATLAERWGIMPQSGGLPMGMTVAEVVQLFAALHAAPDGTAAQVLDLSGLGPLADRRWRRLSGGEQQRLSLAVALCGGRDLLILDEPTAAVDASGREQILRLIGERAAAGAAVLVTTHNFDDIERLADRIVIMHRGLMRASGSATELTGGVDEIRFSLDRSDDDESMDIAAFTSSIGRPVDALGGGRYVVHGPPEPAVVAAITTWLAERGVAPSDMLTGRRTLEDVFLEVTGEDRA